MNRERLERGPGYGGARVLGSMATAMSAAAAEGNAAMPPRGVTSLAFVNWAKSGSQRMCTVTRMC